MVMEKDEIAAMYREAAYKSKEVGILAELNDCSPLLIKEVINEYYPGTFSHDDIYGTKNSINSVLNGRKTPESQLARPLFDEDKKTAREPQKVEKTSLHSTKERSTKEIDEIKAEEKAEETQQLRLANPYLGKNEPKEENRQEKVEKTHQILLGREYLPTIRIALIDKLAKLKEEEKEILDALEEIKNE